ncbi:MAG: hypothetical protein AB7K71_31760 [Polyangiaceae bacterium]
MALRRKRHPEKRSLLEWDAFNAKGRRVKHGSIPLDEWYDELHPVMDENAYRLKHGIVVVRGRQFDHLGRIDSDWVNYFSARNGELLWSREQRPDGCGTDTRIEYRSPGAVPWATEGPVAIPSDPERPWDA